MIAWNHLSNIEAYQFTCGFCGREVAATMAYFANQAEAQYRIYPCPNCSRPNYFEGNASPFGFQVHRRSPSPSYGNNVPYLPPDIERLYVQARGCFTVDAFDAVVLLCRKLLMHISAERGAPENKTFQFYVNFLVEEGHITASNKDWVDSIRDIGNEGNHELVAQSRENAIHLIDFSEMLLRTIYEFPHRIPKRAKPAS